MAPPDNAGFTHISTPNGPETTDLDSLASSFESEYTKTTGIQNAPGASSLSTSIATSESSSVAAAATASSGSQSVASTSPLTSTTFSTSVTSVASSSLGDHGTTTATNAASNTSGAVTVSHSSCDSISCSSALKAAIAVPVVVAAIAGIFLFFFCAKRRRRNAESGTGAAVSEKQTKKAGKKWSRHLRAFSFDAELLMGGRFSSTNSIRSRDPSVRSGGPAPNSNNAQSVEPSLHSIEEEVAPPYRDAISHAHPPLSQTQHRSAVPMASGATDPIPRPLSTATAPPPYGSIVGDTRAGPATPVAATNPFADSAPVSPIEGSPFNDPPEEEEGQTAGLRPGLSRGSSLYHSVSGDDVSEAASIRQAQVGRRVSARATDNANGGGG